MQLVTRSTPVQRKRRWTPRTKTGCQTCRSKRLKCDEVKPICKRCALHGLKCEGIGYGNTGVSIAALSPESRKQRSPLALYPSSVPILNGTAEARDLLHLMWETNRTVDEAAMVSPKSAVLEYIGSAGKPLMLYLEYLPARLGRNRALDSTIDCVARALRNLCLPADGRSNVGILQSYSKALKHLQKNLEDSGDYLSAETLCATQLLGIFESLMRNDGQASMSHVQGTLQLFRLRGAKGFSSDFEKALFVSQLPIITTDASMKCEPCFLEQEDWMSTLRSAMMWPPPRIDRSEFRLSLYEFLLPASRLLGACSRLILDPNQRGDREKQASLLSDIATVRKTLTPWYRRWYSTIHPPPDQTEFTELGADDSRLQRYICFVVWKTYNFVYNRLHVALGGRGSLDLEIMSRDLAESNLSDPILLENRAKEFNLTVALVVSRAILATTEEWQAYILGSKEPSRGQAAPLIGVELWGRYLALCGVIPSDDA